jgi:hypothetical protein
MSYDINIWSLKPVRIPENLPFIDEWKIFDHEAYFERKYWQIVVSNSSKVLEEDIPEEIYPQLPGIKFLTNVSLQPIGAPKSAYVKLNQIVKRIGKETYGIIEDQSDNIYLPTGVVKYVPVKGKKDERFSALVFKWLFTESPLLEEDGIKKFVNLLEKYLPEALPRRYGLFEPPQYKLKEEGIEHFIEYLEANINESVTIYPSKPVVSISLNFNDEWGFRQWGGCKKFRVNEIKVELDSEVLNQPGWKDHLMNFWENISVFIKPFYGEVRFINNLIRSRTTYWVDAKSEQHPIKSWWWEGVPRSLGQAVVIGKPYVELWEIIKEKGTIRDGLYFISTRDWNKREGLNKILGNVPNDIAQYESSLKDKMSGMEHEDIIYPKVFPFKREVIPKKSRV